MKKFFDVNYYYIKTDSPSYIINKHSANLGHMKHLSHKIETYVLCSIKSSDNVYIDNVRYVFFKRNVIGHIKYNLFIIFNKPEYIIIHGMRYGLYSCFLKLLLPKSTNIIVQVHGFALPPSGIKKMNYQYTNKFIDGYFFTDLCFPSLDLYIEVNEMQHDDSKEADKKRQRAIHAATSWEQLDIDIYEYHGDAKVYKSLEDINEIIDGIVSKIEKKKDATK